MFPHCAFAIGGPFYTLSRLCSPLPRAGVFSDLESGGQDSYARAGEAAAEAIGAIRTIAAFGGEKAEVKRVDKHLADAEKTGLKKSMYMGVVVGAMLCCMFSLYAVGLYYGSTLIIDSRNADPTCVLGGCWDAGGGG